MGGRGSFGLVSGGVVRIELIVRKEVGESLGREVIDFINKSLVLFLWI